MVGKTAFFVGKEGLVDSKVLPMHQAPGPALVLNEAVAVAV